MEQIGQAAKSLAVPDSSGRSLKRRAQPGPTREHLPPAIDVTTEGTIPRKVLSSWKPQTGPHPLRRPLTVPERAALDARARALEPAVAPYARPADEDRVADALLALLDSYSAQRLTKEEAMARVDGAMEVLADLPAWSIEEACLRIRRNGYMVIDAKGRARLEQTFTPNDSQIHSVAEDLVKARRDARDSALALLAAPVEESPEDHRPSIAEMLAEARQTMQPSDAEIDDDRVRRDDIARRSVKRQDEAIRSEYIAAGLEPPTGGVLVSLPMMLKAGHTIEEIGGRKVLVGPARRAAVKADKREEE
jgi:hypothetical protein